MQDIKQMFESLGLTGVQTFIASGNVIFETKAAAIPTLEKRIESLLKKELGYEVATLVRTQRELLEIAQFMPFSANEVESAKMLSITFLGELLHEESQHNLMSLRSHFDDFHIRSKEVYWISKTKFSESKIAAKVSRILGNRSTARGFKTVKQIVEKYCST